MAETKTIISCSGPPKRKLECRRLRSQMIVLTNILFLDITLELVPSLFGNFIDFLVKLIQLVIIWRLINIGSILITALISLVLTFVLVLTMVFILKDNVIRK